MKRWITGAFLAVLLTPCSWGQQPVGVEPSSAEASAMDSFAFHLYRRLAEAQGNLFFSPFSLETALAMTAAGARGETAAEMEKVLGFGDSGLDHGMFHTRLQALKPSDDSANQLNVANALWLQKDFSFLPEYLAFVTRHYGAALSTVDYIENLEGARSTINTWVERQTQEKIKELLKRGVLSSDTRLVLTNAIYFNGKWRHAFDARLTSPQPFHLNATTRIDVPMMRGKQTVPYASLEGLSLLELPYKGEELSMVIVLPDTTEGLAALERRLTASQWDDWLSHLAPTEVSIALPRFKVTSEFQLDDQLKAMGMQKAFSSDADFSGMTGERSLAISAVVHKAYADVTEEGTEAAAATAVALEKLMARPVPTFVADHPFVFMIRERSTATILFLGRLVDPKA